MEENPANISEYFDWLILFKKEKYFRKIKLISFLISSFKTRKKKYLKRIKLYKLKKKKAKKKKQEKNKNSKTKIIKNQKTKDAIFIKLDN